MGLRQSCRRISVRHIFGFCECRRHSDLEISADVSTTGCCTLDRAPFRFGDWRIFARARSRLFDCAFDFCCAGRLVKRMDHMLGCDRLVRCARSVHLVAMGVVGSGTRTRFATNEMAVPLARAVRLSARHGRISLHGFDAAAPDRVVVDKITDPNSKTVLDCANARRRSARLRPFRACMAGAPRSRSRFSARVAIGRSTLAVAGSACVAAGADFAVVDSKLDGLFLS
jgi:hypothetical protein